MLIFTLLRLKILWIRGWIWQWSSRLFKPVVEDSYELYHTHTGAPDNGPKLPKTHYLQLGNHAKEAWRSPSAKDKQLIMDGSCKADGLTKQMKTVPTKVNKSITEPVQDSLRDKECKAIDER